MTGGVTLFVGIGSGVGEPVLAKFVKVVPLAGAVTVKVKFVACAAVKVPSVQITLPPFVVPLPLALTNITPTGSASVTVTLLALDGPKFVTEIV